MGGVERDQPRRMRARQGGAGSGEVGARQGKASSTSSVGPAVRASRLSWEGVLAAAVPAGEPGGRVCGGASQAVAFAAGLMLAATTCAARRNSLPPL
ncbi:hypothetical protein EV644_1141 [Kribbella orskensis]|uniref:Uncharacterized protein n=1 Tax=Kribbella orskensis TaxID=2512216 RepID=A0ABY2BDR4_9ACTN|nr:hypothetical protein EV642_1151 [Kribbella sp. VKM Ac-2500]TCO17353.1 hypothetical protein EV644_1141 [Kribbella orskensis]